VASHFVTLKKLQLHQRLFKLQDLHSMGVVWFGCHLQLNVWMRPCMKGSRRLHEVIADAVQTFFCVQFYGVKEVHVSLNDLYTRAECLESKHA
jgi:hypothetical protein